MALWFSLEIVKTHVTDRVSTCFHKQPTMKKSMCIPWREQRTFLSISQCTICKKTLDMKRKNVSQTSQSILENHNAHCMTEIKTSTHLNTRTDEGARTIVLNAL
jgi:uncharacterized CHY-type Zn-finger protein